MSSTGESLSAALRRRWRSAAIITGVALLCYAGLRQLGRAGEALSHSDFRTAGAFSPEYCDPGEPKFISVDRVRGAVQVDFRATPALQAGVESQLEFTVRTASGRPIRPEDLLIKHTRLVHLLVVDPSASDYQHLHPVPVGEGRDGRWSCSYTPRLGGARRFFVEFTPKATARGLYGMAEAEVSGGVRAAEGILGPAADTFEGASLRWELVSTRKTLFAGKRSRVSLRVSDETGRPAALAPVMGAWMHLVAFDSGVGGFVHLHPSGTDPLSGTGPDIGAARPEAFEFDLELPTPGFYRLWAQTALPGGGELFAPFTIEVR